MKPDYKNWVPKGMMLIMLIISAVLLTCFLLFGVCGIGVQGVFRLMLGVLLGFAAAVPHGVSALTDPFPIAGNEGCPNRLWKGRQSISACRTKEEGWTLVAAAAL